MSGKPGIDRAAIVVLASAGGAGLLFFFRAASEVFLPFAVAVVLALALNPAVEWLGRRRVPAWLSTLGIIAIVLVSLTFATVLLERGLNRFIGDLPQFKDRIARLSQELASRLGISAQSLEAVGQGPAATRTLIGVGGTTAASMLGAVLQLTLVVLYLVFLLLGRHHLPSLLERAWGSSRRDRAISALGKIERELFRYLVLRTAVSAVTAGVVAAILLAYGVRFAGLWALLTFFAQYVPFIGPVALSLLPVLVAVVQFPSLSTAGWIALWLSLWHFLVGFLIEPRVFSVGLSLNQTIVLLGVALFGWMWGVVGVLLWVPLMVALRLIARQSEPLRALDVLLGPAHSRHPRGAT